MASISRDKDGMRIQFRIGDGPRRSIRLGDVSMKHVEHFALRVEGLVSCVITGSPMDSGLSAWVRDLPDATHAKLARVGLVTPRAAARVVTFQALLSAYFDALDVKASTRTRMESARAAMLRHFDPARDANTIGTTDAEDWRATLKAEGYAAPTVSRLVIYARQCFRWGMKRGLVTSNPFAEVRAGSQTNTGKQVFITRDTIAKVLDAAPDAEWRLLIALSRFGGLRVPSEALALTWDDVDWDHSRLTVRSPKTEHHEGKAERFVPIFPEVLPYLRECFENAEPGVPHVITRYREGCNLNPQLRRIIKRAGLPPWDRTWHNMRATRQTELAASFPLHTVCNWLGNSRMIAAGHYLQVTDADWERATRSPVHNPAQPGAERGSTEQNPFGMEIGQVVSAQGVAPSCCSVPDLPMVATGLEPVTPVV